MPKDFLLNFQQLVFGKPLFPMMTFLYLIFLTNLKFIYGLIINYTENENTLINYSFCDTLYITILILCLCTTHLKLCLLQL
uniref:Uncharacterized protein n=1 Tax=Ciona savignyi TaxID=51511 RepID=H2Z3Q7_CIOSA